MYTAIGLFQKKNWTPYIEEVHFGKDDHPGFSSIFLGPPWISFPFYPDPPWIFLGFFRTHPGFYIPLTTLDVLFYLYTITRTISGIAH